jgi:hypothetical protein
MSMLPEQPEMRRGLSRRRLLAAATGSALVAFSRGWMHAARAAATDAGGAPASGAKEPFFRTRGVVVSPSDFATWPWPVQAKQAGLTTIATHAAPSQAEAFVKTEPGRAFLEACRKIGVEVEYEQHALSDLLPRGLFVNDPSLFRMDDQGRRTADANLCVSSMAALEIACDNTVKFAEALRPTTGRYFYWIDDGRPMCRCLKCRGLSDSDQALVIENAMIKALRKTDPRASLAHLCYQNTLKPPAQVKPEPGIFLEFAPITRRYDQPLSRRDLPVHAEYLDLLDANLAVFGREGAQALEYWLDVSRFSAWQRDNPRKIPWNAEVFRDDLATYAKRGIRHVTTFACWLDGAYVARFGDPPLAEYGAGLLKDPPIGTVFP